jgi:hypothetical protein
MREAPCTGPVVPALRRCRGSLEHSMPCSLLCGVAPVKSGARVKGILAYCAGRVLRAHGQGCTRAACTGPHLACLPPVGRPAQHTWVDGAGPRARAPNLDCHENKAASLARACITHTLSKEELRHKAYRVGRGRPLGSERGADVPCLPPRPLHPPCLASPRGLLRALLQPCASSLDSRGPDARRAGPLRVRRAHLQLCQLTCAN